jgi:hypothetical protein
MLSLAERVRARDQDRSRGDVHNQRPVPKRDRKRDNREKQKYRDEEREMSQRYSRLAMSY